MNAGFAAAQSSDQDIPDMLEGCSLKDASEFIRVVVCETGALSNEEYITVGRAACGAALPCGTWIWRDPAKAPEKAPANHDGLTKDEVTSASGVWVAEDRKFITIEQVQ